MNWKVVEEWATREKFGIDGGLTAVAYRDELIKVARLAVAERDRAEREKKRADEWADSVFGPKPPGLSKALAMDDREGEVQTDERAEDGRFDWTIEDATSWANAAEKGQPTPPWLAHRYREWLIRCARFAVAERERADELARERNKAIEEGKREDIDDWIDDLYHRMAEAENRLATLTRRVERLDGRLP